MVRWKKLGILLGARMSCNMLGGLGRVDTVIEVATLHTTRLLVYLPTCWYEVTGVQVAQAVAIGLCEKLHQATTYLGNDDLGNTQQDFFYPFRISGPGANTTLQG
jgi:hypothetical protein